MATKYHKKVWTEEPTFDQNDDAPMVIMKIVSVVVVTAIGGAVAGPTGAIAAGALGAIGAAVLRQPQNDQSYRDNGS